MSLYDEYEKEVKAKPGSLYEEYKADSGVSASPDPLKKSYYEQYMDDMAGKPSEIVPAKEALSYRKIGEKLGFMNYLNPVNAAKKGYDYLFDKTQNALAETPLIKGAAEAYNEQDRGNLHLSTLNNLAPELLKGAADPALTLLNTKTGAKITGSIYEGTSNLPLKLIARFRAMGDETYTEARDALIAKRNDPNNNQFEQILYGVQDSGVQSAIGALLAVGTAYLTKNPKAAQAISAPYFAAISAEAQRREKGSVTSKTDIAIDTIGDTLISNFAEKALNSFLKEGGKAGLKELAATMGRGFAVEGTTEPTQTFLKYANDYVNAETEGDKLKIVDQVTNYVKGGGMLNEFLVGGISGALITGGVAVSGQVINKASRDMVKSSEAFNVEESIKNGDITRDQVYQTGDILQPDFAQGRIDDVAQKLDMVQKGLGQQFRDSVDVKNTTYKNIIDTGLKTLSEVPQIQPNLIPNIKGSVNEEEKTDEETQVEKETLIKRSEEINNEIIKKGEDAAIPIKKRETEIADLSGELVAIRERLSTIDKRTANTEAIAESQRSLQQEENIKNITSKTAGLNEEDQVAAIEKAFSNDKTRNGIINDVGALLNTLPEFRSNPELIVNEDKTLTFAGKNGDVSVSPAAVGLKAEDLTPGDTVKVDTKTLAGTIEKADLAATAIRGERGRFAGSSSDKGVIYKMPVERLATLATNSLSNNKTGIREKSIAYYKENQQEITKSPVRVREVEGKLTIEDGRHRLLAAKELGIDNVNVEDVTSQYPEEEGKAGKNSEILKGMNKQNDLASTKGGKKTVRSIIERNNEAKPSKIQEVPADFKISERAKAILQEFGVPIAEKGISGRFLGLYKHATKKVRVQALYDITTVTHEAIHAIDDQIKFSENLIKSTGNGAEVRKQLTSIYEKLYPKGKRTHPLSVRIKEGLAVLFENFFYNPAEITAAYPDLVNSFIKPTGEYYNAQFSKLLEKMNELVDDYASLSPEQRIASRIRTGKEVVKRDKGFTFKQRAIFETFNRFEPLKRYAKQAGVSETWNDPTVQAFNILNKNSIVSEWVKGASTPMLLANGNFKMEEGSVKTYLDMVKGDEKAFYTYLVARRVHESQNLVNSLQNEYEELGGDEAFAKAQQGGAGALEALFDSTIAADPIIDIKEKIDKIKSVIENDDFSPQDAAAVVTKYAEKFAKPEKVYDEINRRLIDVMVENGLLDQETADTYKAEKGYASFKRFIDDELTSVGTLQSASKSKVSSLKQRTGSQLDLQSPIQSQITAISEITGKAFENRLWNKVADLTTKNPAIAQRFEKIEAVPAIDAEGRVSFPQEKDPNVIRVFKNGKREFYKAAPEFLSVSKTLRGKEFDAFAQLLRIPASLFTRLTTSANPLFAVGNLTVDQFTATTQSKTGYKPIIDPMKSFIDVLKGDQGVKMYKALGGKRQTLAAYFDLSPDEVTNKLTGGETTIEKAVGVIDTALGALEWPSNTSEIMTRYAEFVRSIERGEPASVAMYRASEVTTPFQLQGNFGGRFGQEYIKSIPYLNATLQVIYKFARTTRDNPGRVTTMLAGLLAAALTSAIALMKGSSDEQKRALGEQAPANFAKYLYLPSPNGKDLIKIKIPQEFGAITGLAYLYVVGEYGGNKATFDDYLDNVMSALPEQINVFGWQNAKKAAISLVPEALKPSIQVAANAKTFPEVGPIVPPYVVDKAPKEQYNTYTSKVARSIGSVLNASPMLVDFWIRNQFGSLGDTSIKMLSGQGPSSNPIFVEEEKYAMSGRAYNRFYDNKKMVTQQYDEIRKNNPDDYSDTDKEMVKIEKGSYDKMADALSDMRDITQTKKLPEDVKQLAYEILLNLDTDADQEEVRSMIGELKGKIGDLKE